MLHLNESSNGSKVETTVGQSIEIVLAENPTTGYRWQTVAAGQTALELVDELFTPPNAGAVGAGGSRRWLFRAARPGQDAVELAYRRPWEPAGGTKFAVQVVVQPEK